MNKHQKFRDQKFLNSCSYCGKLHFLYGVEFQNLIPSGHLGAICKKCLGEKRIYGLPNPISELEVESDVSMELPAETDENTIKFNPDFLSPNNESFQKEHQLMTQISLDFFEWSNNIYSNSKIRIMKLKDQLFQNIAQTQVTKEYREKLDLSLNAGFEVQCKPYNRMDDCVSIKLEDINEFNEINELKD